MRQTDKIWRREEDPHNGMHLLPTEDSMAFQLSMLNREHQMFRDLEDHLNATCDPCQGGGYDDEEDYY